jgi:hypothetical protein
MSVDNTRDNFSACMIDEGGIQHREHTGDAQARSQNGVGFITKISWRALYALRELKYCNCICPSPLRRIGRVSEMESSGSDPPDLLTIG